MAQGVTGDEENEKEAEDGADTSAFVEDPERGGRGGDGGARDEVSISPITASPDRRETGVLDAQRRGKGGPRYALLPRDAQVAGEDGRTPQ